MKRRTQERFYLWSRDVRLLSKVALLIIVASILVARLLVSTPVERFGQKNSLEQTDDSWEILVAHLRNRLNPSEAGGAVDPEMEHLIEESPMPAEKKALLLAFARATRTDEVGETSRKRLQTAADSAPPERFANEFLGDLASWQRDDAGALANYRKEAALPDADYSRSRVLSLLKLLRDHAGLQQALSDPLLRPTDPHELMEIGVMLRDPAVVWRGVLAHDYRDVPGLLMLLAVVAGLVWFLIIRQTCYLADTVGTSLALGLVGVLLGMVSATATLFASVWQDDVWGQQLNGEFGNDLVYCISGIGLREEVVKLLLFLPLVPWLYRRRDPRLVLLAASCVGLGFAIQENFGYFERAGGGSGIGRFLTANFAHIALTGILGFAFMRFVYNPRREWEQFLFAFITVVVAHGLYDAFIIVEELRQNGILGILIFIYIAFSYCVLLRTHCPVGRQVISPVGVFVLGLALISGLSIITVTVLSGSLTAALAVWLAEIVSTFPFIFFYVRHLE